MFRFFCIVLVLNSFNLEDFDLPGQKFGFGNTAASTLDTWFQTELVIWYYWEVQDEDVFLKASAVALAKKAMLQYY